MAVLSADSVLVTVRTPGATGGNVLPELRTKPPVLQARTADTPVLLITVELIHVCIVVH